MSKQYAIGIDLGGANLRVALISEEGRIIKKMKRPTSENVIGAMTDAIAEIAHGEMAGIGIGTAGVIDRKNGRVFTSPNLPGIERIDIAGQLRNRFNVPVMIENDANAAALGERIGGAGREYENFVLLNLGAGIGGGFVHKGRLIDVPAEVGHMSINPEAERCPCGNIGCLENYASARAMVSRIIAAIEKGTDSILKGCCKGSIYKITPEDIYGAALEGDTLAREILREAGRYLGVGLANIINSMGPDAVILAGGLTGAWNIYVQEAIKEASRRAFKDLFDSVKIIPSALGDNAGVVGAACLVFMCNEGEILLR